MDDTDCVILSDGDDDVVCFDKSLQITYEDLKKTNQNFDASIVDLTNSPPPPPSSSPNIPPPSPASPQANPDNFFSNNNHEHESPLLSASPPRPSSALSSAIFSSSPSPSPPPSPVKKATTSTDSTSSARTRKQQISITTTTKTSARPPKKLSSKNKNSPPSKLDRQAREEAKKLKLQQKEEDQLQKDANRANGVGKALQNCTAILDKNILKLINDEQEISLKTLFDESMLNYRLSDYPPIENSVTWSFKRVEVENNQCVSKFTDSDWIVVLLPGQEYLKLILGYRDNPSEPGSLEDYLCNVKRRSKRNLILIVYDLANFLKSERAKDAKNYRKNFKDRFEGSASNGQVVDEQASSANVGTNELQDLRLMLEVELKHKHPKWKFHIEFYEKTQDVIQSLARFTASVAKFESRRETKSNRELDWEIDMDKEKAVDPTKSFEDLTKLWITQLQQFSQITLPIAKAIAAEYPSPSALLDMYKSLSDSEAEDLLASLHVQKNHKRQIGPNISRRIHCFMTSTDPNVHIGYS